MSNAQEKVVGLMQALEDAVAANKAKRSTRLCEVPDCDRQATEARPQRSGEVLHVCGQPHVSGCDPDGPTGAARGDAP